MAQPSPGQSARRVALDALVEVVERARTIEQAFAAAPGLGRLSPRDRAFAWAVVTAALRAHGPIEALLARHIARPLPAGAATARAILRAGAAQILALGTPAHAAVNESVALARTLRDAAPFASLINAVLRKVAAEPEGVLDAAPGRAFIPAWLFARWCAAYGEARADAIAAGARRPPPLDLTVRADAEGWAARLGGVVMGPQTVRLDPAPAAVADLEGYGDGAWWVQDLAASLPVALLAPRPGETVADLCAAPGGKTLQLAAAGARVVAVDRDAGRLARLSDNLARTGLAAEVVAADVETWAPGAAFDAVLLDAPCTATGTFRRHPEAAWIRRPGDVVALAAVQRRLAAAAAALLAPGGRLVFSTCSLEPEEGPAQAAWIAQELGLARDPIRPEDLPGLEAAVTAKGELRTLPCLLAGDGGMDGFFAARFRKP